MNRFDPTVFDSVLCVGDWPSGVHNFAGWVPCVTGQLSFSMIGRLDGQTEANLAINTDPPKRFVTVFQSRQTTDLPYFKSLVRLFRPWSVSNYLMVASTSRFDRSDEGADGRNIEDDIGVLRGKVFVFGYQQNYENQILSRFRIGEIKKAIQKAARPRTAEVSEQYAAELADFLAYQIRSLKRRKVGPLEVDFVLFRTGELRLSGQALHASEPVQKMDAERRKKFSKSLLHQVYYFIKESAHHHYHHDRDQDNILPLKRYGSDCDVDWRRETLWALTRAVLEKRRRPKLDWQKRAMGILSYADAFQTHVARFVRSSTDFRKDQESSAVAEYDFDHVRQSLLSTHDVNQWRESSWRWRSGIAVTVLLAMSAFLINVNEINERERMDTTWVSDALYFAASNPWTVVLASVIVFLVAADVLRVGFNEIKSKRSYWEALASSFAAGFARAISKLFGTCSVYIAFLGQVFALLSFVLFMSYLLWLAITFKL